MKKKINISRDVESRRRIAQNFTPVQVEEPAAVIEPVSEPQIEKIETKDIENAKSQEEKHPPAADSPGEEEKPKKRVRPAKSDL